MFGLVDCKGSEKFNLVSVSVKCDIQNLLTVCSATFVYNNSSDSNTEALFSFPLEGNCVVYNFEALIGGKTIVGVCRELQEARNMYNSAKDAGHKVAMIERNWSMQDTFKGRIGNFPGHSDAQISLKFVMELNLSLFKNQCPDVDRFSLCLPLILRPRYTPQDSVTDTEVYHVTNEYIYEFRADVTGTKEIKDIFSNNYELKLIFNNDKKTSAQVSLQSKYDGTHDLDLLIDYVKMKVPSVLYEYGSSSDHFTGTKSKAAFYQTDVVMLNFLPDFSSSKKHLKKTEIVFIVDRSGSMEGSNIQRAKDCLHIFLKSLPTNCKFQIYGFGSTFDKAFDRPTMYDEHSIEVALNYQSRIEANFGGTELMMPLKDLYNSPVSSDYSRVAFLLTDGDVGNQDEVFRLARANNHSTRLFTVGIGDGVSTSLVQKVAESGLGKSAFVRDSATLSATVIELLDIALNCDYFTDCKIDWVCPPEVSVVTVPSTIRPLFSNYFLTIFALVHGLKSGDSVQCNLSGKASNITVHMSLAVNGINGVSDDEFRVHRLLAKYKIDEMTPDVEDGPNELKRTLINLSLDANMVTNYTTFVAIDPDIDSDDLIVFEPVNYERDGPMEMDTCYDDVDGCIGSALSEQYSKEHCLSEVMYCYDEGDDDDEVYSCVEESSPSASAGKMLDFVTTKITEKKSNYTVEEDGQQQYQKVGKKSVQDIIMFLVEKQNINGFWKYDSEVVIKIGLNPDKVEKEMPETINDTIWMTALVYLYLTEKVSSREKEWRLFAKKAKEWIENNVTKSETIDDIMKKCLEMII